MRNEVTLTRGCVALGKGNEMIIAVDFDGTCVTHAYPEIGEYIGAQIVLRLLVKAGHKLILHTMRDKEELDEAVKWFEDNGIELYGINKNPTQDSWTDSPKAYANLYIDDAALGCPLLIDKKTNRKFVDWFHVTTKLLNDGIIKSNSISKFDWDSLIMVRS